MKTIIAAAIEKTLEELRVEGVSFVVEHTDSFLHGDYASNVAMVGAKKFGKNPRAFAEEIKEKIDGQIEYVEKIEIANPPFINFHLSRKFFSEKVIFASMKGDNWGANDFEKDKEIMLEYTSPNLFKPLHIGNLVGNIVGESLSRLFIYASAKVRRINYPSDIGLTVAKGVWGLLKTGGNPEDIMALGEAYRAGNDGYENDETAKKEIEDINQALYSGVDSKLNGLRTRGIKTSREKAGELCRMLGTAFDTEIFESEASPIGAEIVKAHVTDGIFERSQDAIIFPGEKYGLHTRVFLNSQGLPTYEAKDLGNFALKQKTYPRWDKSIVVTGGEQREYFKVVIEATRAVFSLAKEKDMEHVPTGFLTLSTGKMSSRKGNVLTGESLLAEMKEEALERMKETHEKNVEELSEDIGVAALKYQILRQSVGSDIVFNKAQAFSFEGDSGPYLQYTHARIASVINKAKSLGIEPSADYISETPYEIERLIYQFPEIVERALKERSPHHLVTFLTELSSEFNTFYAKEHIADPLDDFAPYKIALSLAVKQTLKNGLWLLGIKSPERI